MDWPRRVADGRSRRDDAGARDPPSNHDATGAKIMRVRKLGLDERFKSFMADSKKPKSLEDAARAVLDADAATAEAVEPYRESLAVRALGQVSELGDQPPMRAVCLSVLALGLIGGSTRMTRAGLRMIAAHTLATEAKDFVKHRIDRSRPRSGQGEDAHKPRPGRDDSKAMTSFPSGHSAGAIAVAQAYAREFPEHRAAALAGAGAIAIAQIPRCAHYPTDVGAGLAIGLASELLVDRLSDALQLSGDEPEEYAPVVRGR